jgi:hypothetical protein
MLEISNRFNLVEAAGVDRQGSPQTRPLRQYFTNRSTTFGIEVRVCPKRRFSRDTTPVSQRLSIFPDTETHTSGHVADWSGTTSPWRLAGSSLTHHLVCKYEVAVFLASSRYSAEDANADKKRGWFVAHALKKDGARQFDLFSSLAFAFPAAVATRFDLQFLRTQIRGRQSGERSRLVVGCVTSYAYELINIAGYRARGRQPWRRSRPRHLALRFTPRLDLP